MFPRTNSNGATSDDRNVFCGLEALLPLRDKLTNIGVTVRVVNGTFPLGPGRQHEGCEAGDKMNVVSL